MAEIGEFQPFIFLFSCLKKYMRIWLKKERNIW